MGLIVSETPDGETRKLKTCHLPVRIEQFQRHVADLPGIQNDLFARFPQGLAHGVTPEMIGLRAPYFTLPV